MKLITAIARPDKLADIRDGLEEFGVQGLTVSEASGYGRQKGHKQFYRGAAYTQDLVPKLRIEVLASAEDAPRICDVLLARATTGQPGDGKIWITAVDQIIRVSDRSEGEAAL
ncbi:MULTISPECIES: P-II family nitrogen regulator [Brevibacterium]|uniref:Nitrogen regulatory protein P-II n=1 Tax=Brevibacterium pityocampae TaxID=506594 RepID=A0ABP8JTI7_9MICO|nr:P-II family nitrogen regulator [Brevibacterium sp. CS2]QCP06215.1 P-II family nitrogen regulator [Brevibacterium sp. CS2]